MGDRDQRVAGAGAVLHQVLGEPGHALDVEVVGRLVEEQHVGVGDQQLGEGETATLSARQRPHHRVEAAHSLGPDAAEQAAEDVADTGIACPDVLRQSAEHRLADGPLRIEDVDLGEHAEGGVARPRHAPRVDDLLSHENAQQGGLAAAVAPDHADAGTAVDAERDLVEHLGGAEGEGRARRR